MDCAGCPLHTAPTVAGDGPVPADIMIVGQNPGAEEVRRGRPFIGRSGIRLDALLKLAGIDRRSVYITNLVKHPTPRNRAPLKAEIVAAASWLAEELAAVQPKVILALGALATKALTGLKVSIEKDHGLPIVVKDCLVVPLYHPAASFHNPNLLPIIYHDFEQLKDRLAAQPLSVLAPQYSLWVEQDVVSEAWARGVVGFDVETTSPKRGRWFAADEAEIVGYSVAWRPLEAFYVTGQPQREMKMVLESTDIVKVCHNSKFEYGRLRALGITLVNFEDTKLAAHLLQHPSTHLKVLARQLLGVDPVTYEQVTGGRDMSELSPEEIVEYAAADADNTLRLWRKLEKRLVAAGLDHIYRDVELPLVPVLADMEQYGIGVDEEQALKVAGLLAHRLGGAVESLKAWLPDVDNLNSPDQVAAALEKMGAPVANRTPAKQRMVVDDDALEGLRPWNSGLVDALLLPRRITKMASYVNNFLMLRGKDGRLHPGIQQAGGFEDAGGASKEAPVTGRLSYSGPNLQNIPHRGDAALVKAIRDCIIPSPGKVLLSADVSQEEARILAFVAQEPQMLADFSSGQPVYSFVGEALYGRPISKASDPHEWFVAKTAFLALMYGCDTAKLLSIDPLMSWEQASTGSRELAKRYKRIEGYRVGVDNEVRETGEVRDWFGRRRLLPGIGSDSFADRQQALREGFNMTVQGPAAAVMKRAMRRIWERLPLGARLLLVIHDEFVFECALGQVDSVAAICYNSCQEIMPITFPLEFQVGPSWGSLSAVAPTLASV